MLYTADGLLIKNQKHIHYHETSVIVILNLLKYIFYHKVKLGWLSNLRQKLLLPNLGMSVTSNNTAKQIAMQQLSTRKMGP